MKGSKKIILAALVCLLVISTAYGHLMAQESFVFQQGVNGYDGTSDAHIFGDKKTNNTGNEDMFEATGNGGEADAKHALIRFDLSSVPAGTQIDFAKLSLHFTMRRTTQTSDKELGVFRVNRPWGEGAGDDPGGFDGQPAMAGDVSWNFAMTDTAAWVVPGANGIPDDREGTAEDVQTFSPSSPTDAWYVWDITGMVRFWVANPDSNFGLILREPTVSSVAGIIDFASSEFADVTLRPILSINTFAIQTNVFQQGVNGFAGTTDAHILADKKTNNSGNEDMFEATGNGGENDAKHALIRFDLSSFDAETPVNFAKLSLYFTMRRTSQSQNKELGVFRLNRPWGEGVGDDPGGFDGRPALAGEVSWNFAMTDTVPWAVPGANGIPDDREGAAEDVLTFTPTSPTDAWYVWDITEMVRFWVTNPDSNFGLVLREPTVSSSAGIIDFASSEFETVTLRPILSINTQVVTAVEERRQHFIPITFDLKQNYPNPFNPTTTITYELTKRERVTLKIYNVMGQEVATLVEDEQSAGLHNVVFDANEMASGIYVYTLRAGQFTVSRKMTLVK